MSFSKILAGTQKIIVTWGGPNGTVAKNIFYLSLAGGAPSSPTNLLNGANVVYNAFTSPTNNILTSLSASWQMTQIEAVDNSGGPNFYIYPVSSTPGHVTGDCFPPSVCQGISWSIASRYRGGHPRMYLPGTPSVNAASNGSNKMLPAAITFLETGVANWLAWFPANPASGVTFTPGTIAGSRHNTQLTPPIFYPYTSATVHPRFDTQRRRLGKEILP